MWAIKTKSTEKEGVNKEAEKEFKPNLQSVIC